MSARDVIQWHMSSLYTSIYVVVFTKHEEENNTRYVQPR
jgi:hypothetical protein